MAKKKEQEDYAKSLADTYARWEHLYKYGGQDPSWSDGTNLHLVRNHTIYYKKMIENTMQPEEYPEIYYRNLPPEVSRDYMARSDEIRACAKASLACYIADPDYQFLCYRVESLNAKQVKQFSVRNVIGYVTGLETAIKNDDLIAMRRHRNPANYIKSFVSCAKNVRNLKPAKYEQMNLFGFSYDDEQEFDDDIEEMEY